MCKHERKYYVNVQVGGKVEADSAFCADCGETLYDRKREGAGLSEAQRQVLKNTLDAIRNTSNNYCNQPEKRQQELSDKVEQICSDHRRQFDTGAVRDIQQVGKGRYDLLPWVAIHELAKHCARGAEKYGERNAEIGIPLHSFLDSASRHLSCYMQGKTEEPHLVSALWNIAFAVQTEIVKPEMQDIPARLKG